MKRLRPRVASSSHNDDVHPLNETISSSNVYTSSIVEGQFDDASTSSPDIGQLARSNSTTLQSLSTKKLRNLSDADNEDNTEIQGMRSQDEEVQPNLVSFEETSPKDDNKNLRDVTSQLNTARSQSSSVNYYNQTSQSNSPYNLHWHQRQQLQPDQHGPPITRGDWYPLIHGLGSEDATNVGPPNMSAFGNVASRIPMDCNGEHELSMPNLQQSHSHQTNQPGLKNNTSGAVITNTNSSLGKHIKFEHIDPQSVTNSDVLMGRGGGTNRHNVHFRKMVADAQPQYVQASKKEKTQISKSIVAKVRNHGGRFLKMGHDGLYFDVGDKLATSKTSQALREGLSGRMRENANARRSKSDGNLSDYDDGVEKLK